MSKSDAIDEYFKKINAELSKRQSRLKKLGVNFTIEQIAWAENFKMELLYPDYHYESIDFGLGWIQNSKQRCVRFKPL